MRRARLWVQLAAPVLLLAVGLHAAEQQWGRHEQWGRVHQQQNATELVAEQLGRDLHGCPSAGADSCSPHG